MLPRPMNPILSVFDTDILDLRVAGERFQPLLASVAALLVAAERQLNPAAGAVGIDVDLTGFDARGERHRLVDVTRPDAGDQAVVAAIDDRRGLLELVEVDDRQHRPEDLFLRDAQAGRYRFEQRRLKVVAAAERRVGRPRAAGGDVRAFGRADLHVLLNRFELALRDDRSHVGIAHARTDTHALRTGREAVDQRAVRLALDQQPRPGGAGLPRVLEDRGRDALRREIEIGVGK